VHLDRFNLSPAPGFQKELEPTLPLQTDS
jgi:hypothetical protein